MTAAPFHSILITGATSGLGAALAEYMAAPGITLALTGRDGARLEKVAERCRLRGATIRAALVDVADRDAMRETLLPWDDALPFDLIVANAGVSAGTGGFGETEEQLRHITAVNVAGVINTVAPLLPRLLERKKGQIGLVASLAGFRGLPGAPAYSASKAWVKVYGEGLRGTVAPHGIGVSTICPGFVETPMTAVNRFPMPFLMNAERAASIMARGLIRNKGRIAFPLPMLAAVWLLSTLPDGLVDWLTRKLPAKG
ncbi:SDR family NAD(P)-dependent oxidoreductase [Lacibacterium aquatile]|uniref:SDR family NAD(P)-dependent oxidoreductase n=1 Tax=Lacibacterium aquatile TaxID=1168082 RepID=A0ABW5DUG3_9PROT